MNIDCSRRISRTIALAVLLAWNAGAQAHGNAGAFAAATDDHHEPTQPAAQAPAVDAHGDESADTRDVLQVQSALIATAPVQTRRVTERRPGIGQAVANAGAVHDINAYISGQVRELYVRAGMRVRPGDPIARIDSPEFVLTQKSFVALLGNEAKRSILTEEGRLPDYMRDARDNLRWWGMSDAEIERLETRGTTVEGITVRTPVGGVVSEVLVQSGDLINAGDRRMAQFVVLGRPIARVIHEGGPVWMEGYLFPDQLAGIQPGHARVAVALPGGRVLERPLQELTPTLDAVRQLASIRLELGAVADVYLGQPLRFELLIDRHDGVWLPRAALLSQGLDSVVFVETGPGRYQRRVIEAGVTADDWIAVTGLPPGSRVVTQGKMALEGAYRLSSVRSVAPHGGDHHH